MKSNGANTAEIRTMLAAMAAEARELQSAAGGSVTDAVATWLAPQYLLAAQEKLAGTEGERRFEVLRTFVHDWAMLRRGDHSATRLQLDREELEWQRAAGKAQKEKEFREWMQRPEIRQEFFPGPTRGIGSETLEKIERELRLL